MIISDLSLTFAKMFYDIGLHRVIKMKIICKNEVEKELIEIIRKLKNIVNFDTRFGKMIFIPPAV